MSKPLKFRGGPMRFSCRFPRARAPSIFAIELCPHTTPGRSCRRSEACEPLCTVVAFPSCFQRSRLLDFSTTSAERPTDHVLSPHGRVFNVKTTHDLHPRIVEGTPPMVLKVSVFGHRQGLGHLRSRAICPRNQLHTAGRPAEVANEATNG